MYARVSTIEGSPDKVDDVTRQTQEQTLPQLQKMEGFKGFVALGDRQSGKMLGVSFWESEEALRASEQAVSSVRSGAAGAADGIVAGVEQYEVGGRGHATGERGNGHGGRGNGQPLGRRREEELAKGGHPPPTREEGPGLLHPGPSSRPYSPNLVEGTFPELWPDGVLGSSNVRGRMRRRSNVGA
jgi:heme-degrading monooxygenase HmoA